MMESSYDSKSSPSLEGNDLNLHSLLVRLATVVENLKSKVSDCQKRNHDLNQEVRSLRAQLFEKDQLLKIYQEHLATLRSSTSPQTQIRATDVDSDNESVLSPFPEINVEETFSESDVDVTEGLAIVLEPMGHHSPNSPAYRKKIILQPAIDALVEGHYFLKHNRQGRVARKRFIWLSDDLSKICWGVSKDAGAKGFMRLAQLKNVSLGELATLV